MNKSISEFNENLRFLLRVYVTKSKNTFSEEKATRDSKRLSIVLSTYPTLIFEHTGPIFVKYSLLIHEEKWEELMRQDFTEEKKQATDTAEVDTYINFIKQLYNVCNTKEKEKIGDAIKNMLSSYCSYVVRSREKNQ